MNCFDDFRNHVACVPPQAFAAGSLELWVGLILAALFVILVSIFWAFPIYNVWASRKSGEADLAQANYEQQIQIAEAQGRYNAADLNKKAAVIEAEAVAAQITTIGEHLKQHDLYLRWQWIEMMKHRDGETIYVPTEANLPVLEAMRRAP